MYVVDASTVTGLPSSPGIVTLAATVNGLAVPTYPWAGVKLTFPVVGSTV